MTPCMLLSRCDHVFLYEYLNNFSCKAIPQVYNRRVVTGVEGVAGALARRLPGVPDVVAGEGHVPGRVDERKAE